MTAPAATVRALPDSLIAAFYARTAPLPGGHLAWTGARDSHGTALLTKRGVGRFTALRLAYLIAHRAEPVGRVQAGCDMPGCVAPACVDDLLCRQRDRAALRTVLGRGPRRPTCRRGHDQNVHGGLASNGRSRCNACNHPTT